MAERDAVELVLERDWRSFLDALTVRPETSPLSLPPERRMPLSRTALLALLEEARALWAEIGVELEAEPELLERYVNAGWTLKDLLAHLASWAAEFRREVETVSRHESFDYAIPFAMTVMGPNEWNEEEVERRRQHGLDEILAEYRKETAALEELVLEIGDAELYGSAEFPHAPSGDPSARWRGPAAFLIAVKCLHDRYHFEQVRARLMRFRA